MEERLSWDEIRRGHTDQWVLVDRPEFLTSGELASGIVIAHARDRHALLPGHELEESRVLLWTSPSRHSGERTSLSSAQDTHPAVHELQMRSYRSMDAEKKIGLINGMWQTDRDLALAGIRGRFPHATADEVEWQLAELFLGLELATRVYRPRARSDPGHGS